MNVLTLGARVIGIEPAFECSLAFLARDVLAASRATGGGWTRSWRSRPRASGADQPAQEGASMAEASRAATGRCPSRPSELVARARTERWAERLFERDTSLWSDDPAVQATIADRLGWLDAPEPLHGEIGPSRPSATAIRDGGFTTAIVGGHGRQQPRARRCSSRTFGDRARATSSCASSTRPTRRPSAATVDDLDPLETLFIVASKSGTTTEPLAFMADAWARVEAALEARRCTSDARRLHRRDHRSRARASTRSPTTTTSARSSSTRPTSAVGTRR